MVPVFVLHRSKLEIANYVDSTCFSLSTSTFERDGIRNNQVNAIFFRPVSATLDPNGTTFHLNLDVRGSYRRTGRVSFDR